ncbi:MAG TPA: DNA primase [Candidatus Faecousia faecigallinarum]|nr:DNA primase [Candidatus Faecousia faecigallinarum]
MAFPPSFLDDLVERNPIEDVVSQYVSMTRRGGRLFGLCPFHGEKTASFSVTPDNGLFYCFGCHKGGGVINFVMEIENLSYPDAVRFLAKRAGMEVPEDEQYHSRYRQQERLWALSAEAARFFHAQLYQPAGAQALAYARGRGLSQKILTNFGMGYAPDRWTALLEAMEAKGYTQQELLDAGLALRHAEKGTVYDRFRNRLMFPIIDVRGHVIGFGGRVMDNSTPKYLNSPDTLIFNKRKNLFAMNLAKRSKAGRIILVEGYMDAIALHQYGFDSAVASLGTALTQDQVALLARYTDQVVLIYDGDEAGQNATRRALPMLERSGLQIRVLAIQGAKDPDEYLQKFGADRFKLLLDGAENQMEYQIAALARKYDITQDSQKVEFLQAAADLLAEVGSGVEREVYGGRIAQAAGVSYDTLKLEIDKAARRAGRRAKKKQERIDLAPAERLRPKDRSIRYDNVRSAVAEEGLLGQVLREPALLAQVDLSPEEFSCPLLGRCFAALRDRYRQGLQVNLGALEGFTPEEAAHLAGVAQRQSGPVSEAALADYTAIIRGEHQAAEVQRPEDLLALRDAMRKRKGYH